MDLELFRALISLLADSEDLVDKSGLTLCWHAGEPLAAGKQFYVDANDIIKGTLRDKFKITQSFQTNATLIDREWCDFFRSIGAAVGVSIDGPAFVHDANRRTRRGKGTHAEAMRGVKLLADAGISFSNISVLTAETLRYPDEFYDFFEREGIRRVGLNVDEIEGGNLSSSILTGARYDVFQSFLKRIFELSLSRRTVSFRELESLEQVVAFGHELGGDFPPTTQLLTPFRILTCSILGDISTFSPELSGARSKKYGDFVIGNVRTSSLENLLRSENLQVMSKDILSGLESCRRDCGFFAVCQGGSPSNKYFEKGDFAVSETRYCNYARKAMFLSAIGSMESRYLESTTSP